MAPPASQQALLAARRKADDAFLAMEAVLADHDNILKKANFEKTTTAKIERRIKANRLEELQREGEVSLFHRRRALADMFNAEIAGWRQEVLNSEESLEDKKENIKKKAYALRDAREAEREAFLRGCYDSLWRDSCDDARALDSIAMTKYMNQERLDQIQAKRDRNQQLSKDENSFLAEWKRQLEAIEARDKAKRDARYKNDMDTAQGIRDQIAYNEGQRETNWRMQQESAEQEIRECNEAIAAEEAKQKGRHDLAHRMGKETSEFNKQFRIIAAETAAKEREQNSILLNYALEQERLRIQEEEDAKNAWTAAAKQQRKYLEELMVREAQDTSFVDNINKREAEKVWKARDDALQAREDARNYLMKMVKEGRAEQIRAKAEVRIKEKQDDKEYAKKFIGDVEEGLEIDRRAVERRRDGAVANNVQLTRQIELRRMQEELAKQDSYLEEKRMRYIERQHMQRLAMQGGAIRTQFPLMKNNYSS